MKLVSFNCTIELNKDKDGYPNHVYIDVNADNVHLTQPYTNLDAKTAAFMTKLEHDFINHSIDFNHRIDKFNRDMGLEEYAPKVSQTEESTSESASKSSVPQPLRGGSDQAAIAEQIGKDYEKAVEERSLAKTIEDNVIESLGLR